VDRDAHELQASAGSARYPQGKGRQVRTLFANKGFHIQFNVLDTEKLREAQKHPENFRDLVVRVAGFSAFFCQLDVGVQNEIIERTLQSTE
jgi:pyruvate-formate lyase